MAWLSFGAALWKGGRTEATAAAVLICDHLLVPAIFYSPTPHAAAAAAAAEGVTTLIFLWLAFSRDRWWLFAAAAGLVLCSMVHVLRFLHPEFTDYAADSAQIGLWMFIYLSLAAGVGERWLAGERGSPSAASNG